MGKVEEIRARVENLRGRVGGGDTAMGSMMKRQLLPEIAQLTQQNTAAIINAIANIRMPDTPGIDPMMLQQIEMAINNIKQPDLTPLIEIMANVSEQVAALPDCSPREWTFEVARDPRTEFITSVKATPWP